MKCSNPICSHAIGLLSYRRGLFDKRRFCSKQCRNNFKVEKVRDRQPERGAKSYFEWLFDRAGANTPSNILAAESPWTKAGPRQRVSRHWRPA